MRNYIMGTELDISIGEVNKNKVTIRLDENYSNQFFYDSRYEELMYYVFNNFILSYI